MIISQLFFISANYFYIQSQLSLVSTQSFSLRQPDKRSRAILGLLDRDYLFGLSWGLRFILLAWECSYLIAIKHLQSFAIEIFPSKAG